MNKIVTKTLSMLETAEINAQRFVAKKYLPTILFIGSILIGIVCIFIPFMIIKSFQNDNESENDQTYHIYTYFQGYHNCLVIIATILFIRAYEFAYNTLKYEYNSLNYPKSLIISLFILILSIIILFILYYNNIKHNIWLYNTIIISNQLILICYLFHSNFSCMKSVFLTNNNKNNNYNNNNNNKINMNNLYFWFMNIIFFVISNIFHLFSIQNNIQTNSQTQTNIQTSKQINNYKIITIIFYILLIIINIYLSIKQSLIIIKQLNNNLQINNNKICFYKLIINKICIPIFYILKLISILIINNKILCEKLLLFNILLLLYLLFIIIINIFHKTIEISYQSKVCTYTRTDTLMTDNQNY